MSVEEKKADGVARLQGLQIERATILEKQLDLLKTIMTAVRGPLGRPESAELTLGLRKLQEAGFWIHEHLAEMPLTDRPADRYVTSYDSSSQRATIAQPEAQLQEERPTPPL